MVESASIAPCSPSNRTLARLTRSETVRLADWAARCGMRTVRYRLRADLPLKGFAARDPM